MRNVFNRRNKSKCNAREIIPKKKKNIKPKALSPFLPGNKRLLNEDNYDNPETTDTSISEKYDMSHTSPGDFTEKQKTKRYKR